MSGLYLSKDKQHLASMQRDRRKRITRVDYMPGASALAVIEERKRRERPGSVASTNSAVIDAIVLDWARMTGINNGRESSSMTLPKRNKSSSKAPTRMTLRGEAPQRSTERVVCGAKRHRDGQPCQAKSEPGKRRCRFHGGMSTGPRTTEGKLRVARNLPHRKGSSDAV